MRNRLTFANVIGVLLENKKKTYPQHQLVRNLFSAYLDDTLVGSELFVDDNIQYSRWCNGTRPIPMDIIKTYEDDEWDTMEDDFRDKIIPNLLNESQARTQMEELITDSIKTIGQELADALISENDNAAFFCSVVRYAILNDHSTGALYSPDLSEVILGNKLPSCNQAFIGRKDEIKSISSHLSEQSVLFITGMAGIGKSEVAKAYAQKNRKKYTNIIYLYYTGDLRKDIANLTFADDSIEMNEEMRFEHHYKVMQKLHTDTLLILDNFNVLPKDEPFLRELMKNDMQILITSRCKLKNYDFIEVKELGKEKELTDLFYKHCPSAKSDPESVAAIVEEVNGHTLTVCMAALTLEASGIEPEELLQELRSCGIGQNNEEIEVFKDDEFSYASMIGHLRKLMKLNGLNADSIDILRNLSLLPVSGVPKSAFKQWLELDSLKDVNELIRYGIISEDTENKTIALHPLIQEVAITETIPTVSDCHVMLNHLHLICLAHGLDVKKPLTVMECLKSINKHIIMDNMAYYLLFLQDMYPYFDKYLATDYLPELVERIEYVMNLMNDSNKSNDSLDIPDSVEVSACDKALLLDYKAQLLFPRKEYDNAIKKYKKAIALMENYHEENVADARSASLLSNLHNNLSTAYLFRKKHEEAVAELKTAFSIRKEYANLGLIESNDTLQQTLTLANMLVQNKEFDSALEVLDFCESTIVEVMGTNNLDYGMCELYRGVIAYTRSQPQIAEQHLLNADAVFRNVMNENPGNDYSKSTARFLYSLYMRWRKTELADAYKSRLLQHQ
jgi:tetratricopeptide (TPR) repeat protein